MDGSFAGSSVVDHIIAALNEASGVFEDEASKSLLKSGTDVPLDELDVDSLARFEAIMLIEERLGIDLDDDEVTETGSILSLAVLVEQKVAASSDA